MEVINLNFIPSGANPVAHASQFDEGRTTRFNLYDGSTVYTLDGTETLTVSVRKPDGHIVTESVTNTSSTYVDITTTEQMTACAGDNLAQIKVEKGGNTVGFLNYILTVQKDPEDGGDPSESFVHNLEAQIAQAVADQYDAADVVFDAVPTAGHGVGYVVTSEGTPDELEDLTDVTYTGTPALGEAVVWDGSKWTNGTVSTVGSIDDLNDVDTTGKAEGDSLRYNSTAQEWEARPVVYTMDEAEFTALAGDYTGYENSHIVVADAPNLNPTANDIGYDASASYDSGSVGKAIKDLNKPTALTISGVPTGVTSNSKAYKISDGLILVMIEVTFSSASNSWQNVFDIAWSGNTSINAFGSLSNDTDNNTYAQAYWNTDKITVRVSSPKATLYRGQILVPAT